jgi:hypothetical protein
MVMRKSKRARRMKEKESQKMVIRKSKRVRIWK